MRRLTKYTKIIKYTHIGAMLFTALLVFLLVPAIGKYSESGNNLITVFVNGTQVGVVNDSSKVDSMILEARKRIAKENDGLVLINYEVVLSGSRVIFGKTDAKEDVINNIYQVFLRSIMKTKQPVYEVKINEFTVNLKSSNEVLTLLRTAKSKYDENNEFTVDLVLDSSRQLNVLTTKVTKTDEIEEQGEDETSVFPTAGAYQKIQEYYDEALNQETGAFEFGVTNLDFGENVEVVQAYVDSDKISTLDEAIELVTKDQEKSKIYEVEAGDSLSVIAQKNDTTIDEIIAMNKEIIPDENATIRVGDEIKVNMPEPELSVVRTEQVYYEEEYDEDIQYVDNDSWYTTKSQVLQEPVAGFRKVVADITYRNDEEESRELIYEDVVAQAVAKIVERGTKTPPTYMKPVSGGRLSSGFGKRTAPTKGASTYHEGVDWAVPIGTAVVAASGGQVIRAGWGSGYGYCVYIQHPDGIVTRYGHLSKILVKTGQTVKQGEKIALSGNTGVSSGPHLHFEIRVNGTPVNPLNYLN
ncbi:MAG TPA: M23 family metallopeptidase [Lachnospiraceae bacterium]|nr:M23 family metallopeptidase [Lachnospiraceae bacterium]